MTLTIVDEARPVTGGVDTHADNHVAAALDSIGGLLGVREFAATPAGYARLLGWLQGLARCAWSGSRAPVATAPGWPGMSPRPGSGSLRWTARTGGIGGARQAGPAGRGQRREGSIAGSRIWGAARRDGQAGAIRALMVAKHTARAQRTQTINQARALIITGPDD